MLKLNKDSALNVIVRSAIFCVSLLTRLIDLSSPGLTWDEPVYINAGRLYVYNILHGLFTPTYWWYNWEHPPLEKYLIGMSFLYFGNLGLDEVTIARIPNTILGSIGCCIFYMLLRDIYGDLIGITGALSLSFMPRFFAHTRYASLDAPEAVFWILTLYAIWRSKAHASKIWVILSGVFSGLALSVKINAITLPIVILGWLILIYDWREFSHFALLKFLHYSFLFLACSIGTFIFLWPLMWYNLPSHFLRFFFFHLYHFKIPTFYLGKVYPNVPWHYPIVMLLVTTPIPLLIFSLLGISISIRSLVLLKDKRDEFNVMLLVWFIIPLIRVMLSYGYDGLRLFLEVLPAWIGFSCVGVYAFLQVLTKSVRAFNTAITLLILSVLTLSSVLGCIETHPYETAYFNKLTRSLVPIYENFEPIYWGEPYKEGILWIEKHSHNALVYVPFASHLAKYYARSTRVTGNLHEFFNLLPKYNRAFILFMYRTAHIMTRPFTEYCLRKLPPLHTIRANDLDIAFIYDIKALLIRYSQSEATYNLKFLLRNSTLISLNITEYCNSGLKDNTPNDLKGGWVDEGRDDLRYFPRGFITFTLLNYLANTSHHVIFYIPKSDPSCIVLGSKFKPQFPSAVRYIRIQRNVRGILFLHTAVHAHNLKEGVTIGYYKIVYHDNSSVLVPLIIEKNIRDWKYPPLPMDNALPAWVGRNDISRLIVIYVFPWLNPYPNKEVMYVDFLSAKTSAVPILLSITLLI